MTLGRRIMRNRKRLGLTQDQLAEKLGVTAQAVSKWENDQSCPDIAMLPRLADIFGISTDELLGREPEEPVYQGQVEQPARTWLQWGSEKTVGLYFALLIISLGGLMLADSLLNWGLGFWTILWTSALTLFGLFGLFPRFSFFRLGCAVVGLYCLVSQIVPMPAFLRGSALTAVLLLLCGISLLADLLTHRNRPVPGNSGSGDRKAGGDYRVDRDSFRFSGSFGSHSQVVQLDRLQNGRIETSFGEYQVDLSGVREMAPGAVIRAECSFGELTIRVPRRFRVVARSSSAFASVDIQGSPQEQPQGEVILENSASFGQICIQYL